MPLSSIVKEPRNSIRSPPAGGRTLLQDVRRTEKNGGADRDRTGGLRLAKPALSQLSYSPAEKSRSPEEEWWA